MAAPIEMRAIQGVLMHFFTESDLQELVHGRKRSFTAICATVAAHLLLPREIVPKVEFSVEYVIADMSSSDFKSHFRIERGTYQIILERLQTFLVSDHIGGKEQVSHEKQLLLFLWYLANQESMRELAVLFKLSLSTVHGTVRKVSRLFYRVLDKVIQWPDENRQVEIETAFQHQCGIPNVVGIIDGTHVRLSHIPDGDQDYINRKGYPSVQLQLVVDNELLITSAQTGWPGCAHDARVLRNSGLHDRAALGNLMNHDGHILGDSAYPLRTWLVTPYRDNGRLRARQKRFNQTLSSCRQNVERAIGHLKGRFRRLREVPLFHIDDVCYLIMAGCILHNLCVINDDVIGRYLDVNGHPNRYPNVFRNDIGGEAKRQQLLQLIP